MNAIERNRTTAERFPADTHSADLADPAVIGVTRLELAQPSLLVHIGALSDGGGRATVEAHA